MPSEELFLIQQFKNSLFSIGEKPGEKRFFANAKKIELKKFFGGE